MLIDLLAAPMGKVIQPADVYELVIWNNRMIITLAVLVAIQIVAKVILFTNMIALWKQTNRLLQLVEVHGLITDNQKSRIDKHVAALRADSKTAADRALEAAQKATQAVDEIPEKTAEKVVQKIKTEKANGSDVNLGGG